MQGLDAMYNDGIKKKRVDRYKKVLTHSLIYLNVRCHHLDWWKYKKFKPTLVYKKKSCKNKF